MSSSTATSKEQSAIVSHEHKDAADPWVSILEKHLDGMQLISPSPQVLGDWLRALAGAGLDRLPLPGNGRTLQRWRALASVAAHDLGLVKLFEGHTDALAIMAELGAPPVLPGSTWGVWAAEPPQARVTIATTPNGSIEVNGRKAWCSGAPVLSHALLTAWDAEGNQRLVAVALDQPGVRITSDGWQAVGMAATASVDTVFDGASGDAIGAPGAYLSRPGFWHGGAGTAACWYGAAAAIGEALLVKHARRHDPHAMAHLGAVGAALAAAAAVLRETAATIDQEPRDDVALLVLRTRAVVETAVESVIRHVGRALGAAPFCRDARFARLMADLPVFVRQSHAERDLEALGNALARDHTGLRAL